MKKIKYYILAIFSVLALCLVPVGRVSALSDYSVTFTSDSDLFQFLCVDYTTDVPLCSGYKYLLIETNFGINSYSSQFQIVYFVGSNVSQSTYLSLNSPKIVLDVDGFSRLRVYGIQYASSLPSDWSVTFTLSENNPAGGITPEGTLDITSNGTYDVTNYASASVEVEESSFIVQLFSKGFWGVATAIVTIVVPIIALFIVFRLVHDLLWGRG